MDPATAILIPGFLGWLVIAAAIILLQRRATPQSVAVPYRPDPITPNIINMASIKVAGVGGLGLVAMAAAVALDVPRIAQSVGVGIALGTIGAVIVIWRRRQTGVFPSSGRAMGANTTLAIDSPVKPGADTGRSPDAVECCWLRA
jgi:hypothetical protein